MEQIYIRKRAMGLRSSLELSRISYSSNMIQNNFDTMEFGQNKVQDLK